MCFGYFFQILHLSFKCRIFLSSVAFLAGQKQLPGWVSWVLNHVSSFFNFWDEGGEVLWTSEFRHDDVKTPFY